MNLKSAKMDIRSFIVVCDFFSITWSNVFDIIAIIRLRNVICNKNVAKTNTIHVKFSLFPLKPTVLKSPNPSLKEYTIALTNESVSIHLCSVHP